MPTLASGSTLLDMVQNELRIPVTNNTERVKIAQLMALVYGDICAKQDWWWLAARFDTQTVPKITGTASLTQNNATVTFSTAPTDLYGNAADVSFRFLQVDGQADDGLAMYQLGTHTASALTVDLLQTSTSGTLSGEVYTGETNTAAAYRIHQPFIQLPPYVAKLYSVKRYGEMLPMQRIGHEEMMRLREFDRTEGRPEVYTIYDYSPTTLQRYVHFHPFSDKAYRVEMHYKYADDILSGGTLGNPRIPPEFAQVLVYGALARAYPIFLNDLERGAFYQSLFNDVMALMSAQQREYASDQPGIDPTMNIYRKPTRRTRGLSTLGNWFDRLPYRP